MVDVEEYEASRDGLRPGPHIVLVVEDSGQGMDQETLEKVFDPFFTTKGVGEGTGLGLSVVHGIITSHGGDIAVTSREGAGSRFVVRLPCTRLHTVDRQEREDILVGKERILIVDDEPLVCDLGQRILESLGYSVAGDTDSRRALETFLQNPEAFDLVVTDQTMPDLTGLELVREMRRVRPELPVIITSGRKTDDVAQARDLAFLQKPFSVAEIGAIVRRVLDGSPPHRNQRAASREESAAS
jgi:CheY-like chemotaxis protein